MRRVPAYSKRHTVAYVGPYPPDRSGAAMFTMDLVNATDLFGWQSIVVSTHDSQASAAELSEDRKVAAMIVADDPASYATAAETVRRADIDAICIHYIPALFGDPAADYLPLFARSVHCPVVVILHSIDPEPSIPVRRTIGALIPVVDKFVTMAQSGVHTLEHMYEIPRAKIQYIPHGTPHIECGPAEKANSKERLGLTGRTVLTTFGFLNPRKGFDDAISALTAVVADHPDVVYMILGVSDPAYRTASGVEYREQLIELADHLGLAHNVRVFDERLDLPRLIEHLNATDIYIHADPADSHKVTSGALVYALAAGNLIVSTPTAYAQELLAHRRGYLFPFRDVRALALRICAALDEPIESDAIRQRAYGYGRGMTWEDVGLKYVELFNDLIQNGAAQSDVRPETQTIRGKSSTERWETSRLKRVVSPRKNEASQ